MAYVYIKRKIEGFSYSFPLQPIVFRGIIKPTLVVFIIKYFMDKLEKRLLINSLS